MKNFSLCEDNMYCVKCAAPLNDDSKYCSNCGTSTSPMSEVIDGAELKWAERSTTLISEPVPPSRAKFLPVIRVLISIAACLVLIAVSLQSGGYLMLDGVLGQAQDSLVSTENSPLYIFGSIFILIAFLVGFIGLWVSARWSRAVFTVLIALTSFSYMEPIVYHPIESILDELFYLTIGAILALIWISDEFGAPLSQNCCRLVRITNPGAIVEERSGEIRTSLQGQSSGAVVAA